MIRISPINQINKSTVKRYPTKPCNNLAKPKINLNTAQLLTFRGYEDYSKDIHPVSFMEKYLNRKTIREAIKYNPIIASILGEYNLKPVISENNINEELRKHLYTTYSYSRDIAEAIGLDDNSKNILYQAALIHDIGKALIPEKILQKPKKLTDKEQAIVALHAELGYEIVRNMDLDPNVADAIFLHHTSYHHTYNDLVPAILAVADNFSALTEKRVYRQAYSNDEAFEIMKDNHHLNQKCVKILENIYGNITKRFPSLQK